MKSTKSFPLSAYGNWPSAISSELIANSALQLDELRIVDGEAWWLERHPEQGGRVDIVHLIDGRPHACLPREFSCRSRVHEYGGGSFCVTRHGVYFVNDHNQGIYLLADNVKPRCIAHGVDLRFADLCFDAIHNRILCVQETHTNDGAVINSLVSINAHSGKIRMLASGDDFYASPRPSPDGHQLAWLSWNHPDMPWDSTRLWLAQCSTTGELSALDCVAGSHGVSVFQPEWSPGNELYFVDDRNGWWNLYRHQQPQSEPVLQAPMEFGLPQWVFGQRCYSFIDSRQILCSYIRDGQGVLGILDSRTATLTELDTGYDNFSCVNATADHGYFIGSSSNAFASIIKISPALSEAIILKSSFATDLDRHYFSKPRAIEFKTRHGDCAHAIYYPPCNPDVSIDTQLQPPLIVITHGGPTACNNAALDLRKQYWSSRGFALLDVNYSGSTGYGRAYRERLHGQWGIRDAEDCCDGALHLVDAGLVDPERLIIRGSSAGGYTVLCALTFHKVFCAGASYYGIGELEALAKHTHKFEAHYMDQLIGPYPQMREIYHQRSPVNFASALDCPVIFFQGEDDNVVPREQAEMMFEALKQNGVATSYLSFSGEAHGFRKAATLIACLKAELEFYARTLGLPLDAECDGSLRIENLAPN